MASMPSAHSRTPDDAVRAALAAVFDAAPIGVIALDPEGFIVYVNARQSENSRLSSDEFLGRHYRTHFHASLEGANLLPLFDRLHSDGTPFEVTLPYYRRHSDSALLSFSMRGYRYRGHTILLTTIDTALAAQLARFEQLYENANDGIFILSREGRFVAANRKFAEMTGVAREELVGETTEIFLPGRFAQSLERLERIIREGRLGPYELEISTPVGRKFLSLNGFALIENGEPIGVMNIARDTTEEHRRSQERETLYQFAHDLASTLDVGEIAEHLFGRLQSLFGTACGALLLDEGGGRMRCAATSRPTAAGPASDLSDGACLEDADLRLAATVLETRTVTVVADVATSAQVGARVRAWLGGIASLWAAPLPSGGESLGMVLVGFATRREPIAEEPELFQRIVEESSLAIERARLAEELRTARDEALEASRVKSAFLANMSHEIRTPLNVILGHTSLLSEHLAEHDDHSQDSSVAAIQRSSQRLLDTIREVLDISRIEARAFEVRPEPIELDTAVRRQVDDLAPLVHEKGLTISFESEAPGAWVLFDAYCLNQALTNLLGNAIKFTEAGGVDVRIYRDADGALCLDVRDSGIGIEAAYLPHLFQAFSQADMGMTRRFEGSGLGLALSKKYLELNEAGISVRSRVREGSVFTIRFAPRSEIGARPSGRAPKA